MKFQLTEHFLFNFETAISSLAIVVSIYALLLEKRFRARIAIKRNQLRLLVIFACSILFFTFIGAILPYLSGEALPLFGYPVFWEIFASILLFFSLIIAYKLIKPISKLTKKQIEALCLYAPHSTIKYNGEMELILKEAEYFWPDFLKKTIDNENLNEVLNKDFSKKDFLKIASKSYYIIFSTVDFVSDNNNLSNIKNVKNFLRELILTSLLQDESVLTDDLNSPYKDLTQYIIREKKLTNIIFDKSFNLLSFDIKNNNKLNLFLRILSIFELYLGRKYHYTEKTDECLGVVGPKILKNFLDFFERNLYTLNTDELEKFLTELSRTCLELKDLSKQNSEILAEGIYKILESAASVSPALVRDTKRIRHAIIYIEKYFISANKTTKKIFDKLLLEKIVGTKNKKGEAYYTSNLDCYYPMMIPLYFQIYGYELFSNIGDNIKPENYKLHLVILKKMQKRLPLISSGKMQEYLKIELPKDARGKEIIKKRAEQCLDAMFPDNVFYDRELNTITYIFGNEEASETILLNETSVKNTIVYKE